MFAEITSFFGRRKVSKLNAKSSEVDSRDQAKKVKFSLDYWVFTGESYWARSKSKLQTISLSLTKIANKITYSSMTMTISSLGLV